MAKAASFDVVSKVDLQEVDNAVNQTMREISQRYDFRGSVSTVEWDGKEEIKLLSDSELRLDAVIDVLKSKVIRRGIAVRALQFGKVEQASGGHVRQVVTVAQGISREKGREIVASIKALKLKVQAQIMDDQMRVSGKSRDDLQATIQALKDKDFGVELQFVNFR